MRLSLLLPAASAALILAGCLTPKDSAAHTGQPYIVTSDHCDFYSFGPAQAGGPDFALNRGQRVTMLSYQYGYSQVSISASGQGGWVPTERIAPAPPLAAQPSPTATPAPAPGSHRRHYYPGIEPYTAPPASQQRVPLPIFPETQPPPGSPPFRY